MRKWRIIFSADGIDVDYEVVIESEEAPGFWVLAAIARAHNCEYWTVLDDTGNITA